ncbi:ABC transporter ATP-binding protein/permease [Desulfovibrio mangrovi]|uniref:ABC transporter ATP-binding protein n=1 Tax=Desulfovibrio mangrovi TaxID=2976983 RepID=UPI002247ADD5|nr:ABC transporter ATP-binding protein [Desulfovibrio mangrovi]UZP66754.1 ABC transporter ATP-binding protein/permease [Desulfovibrio mangrovi]
MSLASNNFFVKTISIIPAAWRRRLVLITLGILLSSIVETGAVAVIALFISSINDPAIVLGSPYFNAIRDFIPPQILASDKNFIIALGLFASFLMLAKNGVAGSVTYAYSRLAAKIDAHFGGLLLQNYLGHDYEWHVGRHSADLVTAGSWRKNVIMVWYMGMLALNDIVLVSMMGLVLLITAPLVSIGSIIPLGLIGMFIYRALRPRIDRHAKTCARFEMEINKRISNIAQGIKEIIISSNQPYFFDLYQKDVECASRSQSKVHLLSRIPSWAFETAGFITLCGVILVSITFSNESSPAAITGPVALLAVVAWRSIPAFNRIVNSLSSVRDYLPRAEAVINAINDMPAQPQDKSAVQPLAFEQGIAVRNVTFNYADAEKKALSDVSMTIRTGETVGLVGRSGSGKSTLADLIIGLLTPTGGDIAIDDSPLDAAHLHRWRANVGYVGQAPFFTDGTITENVAFGIPEAEVDRDKVARCCTMAALETLIAQLPEGYDQPLGERAAKLSGGQRQRIAIARALYRSPRLLVLDEATSALDQQSENAIQRTVRNLAGSLTMLIIAHRLTTVEHCDRIVWLEDGKIIMDGTPDEVLPHYRASLEAAGEQQ